MVWNRELKGRLEAESGVIIKDWGGCLPVAVVFPNNYNLGMSNLGIHVLYKWLNGTADLLAERVFWDKKALSSSGPLSIESRRPLTDFSIIAFSISWELDYLNVPPILRSAGIPVNSSERDETHPLVIGGGAALTANPAPTAAFFDAVCIGEAEAILPGLIDLLNSSLELTREQLLDKLATLPGIYVPSRSQKPVKRLWVADLDAFTVGTTIFTRETEFGDMYLMEAQRGCRFSCRFCMVTRISCPFRWRSVELLLRQAEDKLNYRDRIALVGPIVSEHPQIIELLRGLRELGFGLSMSSMRVKPISTGILQELVKGGVKSLTIAPEAGTERLRLSIGKGFSDTDIIESVERIGCSGIKQLTLYSMVGLPEETDEDIQALISLVMNCKKKADKYRLLLSLNVSAFVPKPQTLFERQPMANIDDINNRFSLLERTLPPRGIKVKTDNTDWGAVQAALARGDERLSAVIEQMDRVSLAGWRRALKQNGLSTQHFAGRRFDDSEILPWDMVQM